MSPGETPFRAWSFPPDFAWEERVASTTSPPGGGRILHPRLDGNAAGGLARTLREDGGGRLSGRSAAEVARILGRVGERFLDPGDPWRREALERLPGVAGISPAMARLVLRGMARDWTGERLVGLLRYEFPDPRVLDAFRPGPDRSRVRARGPKLSVTISAGTVPGASVASLIRSLLVKSPVIVKPGRGDTVLPVLFARALREEDPELARAVAVAYWPGGRVEVEEPLLAEAEAVVVYGSDSTVRALRERTPLNARFVAYRHRIGAALLGRDTLRAQTLEAGVRSAARAVATFDQRGCVSPHAFYVERGGEVEPLRWVEALAEALGVLEEDVPSGPLLPEEGSRLQQLRGVAELEAAADPQRWVAHGGAEAPWTVVLEPEARFRPSCLGRTVRVHPVDRLEEGIEALSSLGPQLQSVALECSEDRREELARRLGEIGAHRVTNLERLPWPPPWWHHDGRGPLRVLVRWVDLEE